MFYGQADRKRWPPPFPPPPPYGQLFVIFFGVHLTLEYDYKCSETDFTQEIISAPHCLLLLCASVTEWSNSDIAGSLRTWKMHFWDSSQENKMCFEYQKYMFFSAEFLSKFGGPPQFFWGGFPKKGKPQNTTQRIVFVKEGGGPSHSSVHLELQMSLWSNKIHDFI